MSTILTGIVIAVVANVLSDLIFYAFCKWLDRKPKQPKPRHFSGR